MTRGRFICKNCGNKFEADVFEPGEAKEKRMSCGPVICPKCKSGSVERR